MKRGRSAESKHIFGKNIDCKGIWKYNNIKRSFIYMIG